MKHLTINKTKRNGPAIIKRGPQDLRQKDFFLFKKEAQRTPPTRTRLLTVRIGFNQFDFTLRIFFRSQTLTNPTSSRSQKFDNGEDKRGWIWNEDQICTSQRHRAALRTPELATASDYLKPATGH